MGKQAYDANHSLQRISLSIRCITCRIPISIILAGKEGVVMRIIGVRASTLESLASVANHDSASCDSRHAHLSVSLSESVGVRPWKLEPEAGAVESPGLRWDARVVGVAPAAEAGEESLASGRREDQEKRRSSLWT